MEYIIEDVIIGRVYMIYNILNPMIYIGSTITTLSLDGLNMYHL